MNKIDLVRSAIDTRNPDRFSVLADDFQFTNSMGEPAMDKSGWQGMGQMMERFMNPMSMMGPMMNPMGMMNPMMGMGGMGGGHNNANPMGSMMDPKQYESWFDQMTKMMESYSSQSGKKE